MVKNESTSWNFYKTELAPELALICISVNAIIMLGNICVVLTFTKMGKLKPQHIYMLGLVPSEIILLAVNITISVNILKGGL